MISTVIDKLVFVAVLLLLILMTIPDGSRVPVSTHFLTASIGALFCVYVLFCFGLPHCKKSLEKFRWIWISLIVWIGFTALQTIGGLGYESYNRFASYKELALYTSYVFFFFMAVVILDSRMKIAIVVFVLVAVGIGQTVFGMYNYFNGITVQSWQQSFYTDVRLSGSYVNRNFYANLMVMLLGFSVVPLMVSRQQRQPMAVGNLVSVGFKMVLYLAIAGFLISGILLSGSRGAVVSAGAAIIVVLILVWRSNVVRGNIIPLVLAFIAGASLFGYETMKTRFWTLFSDSNPRIEQWLSTLNVILEKPFLGFGPGSYEVAYKIGIPLTASPLTHNHAHNEYLELWLEQGIIGCLPLLIFILLLFHYCYKRILGTRSFSRSVTILSAFFGMCGILVHSMFDFPFQVPANALVFFMLCAICLSSSQLKYERRRTRDNG